jgi:hypothetical protein
MITQEMLVDACPELTFDFGRYTKRFKIDPRVYQDQFFSGVCYPDGTFEHNKEFLSYGNFYTDHTEFILDETIDMDQMIIFENQLLKYAVPHFSNCLMFSYHPLPNGLIDSFVIQLELEEEWEYRDDFSY